MTSSPNQVGFQARSVVGGVFLPMLADTALRRTRALMLTLRLAPTSRHGAFADSVRINVGPR